MQAYQLFKKIVPIAIFSLAILSFSVGITGDIYMVDEARNAECAREMLETGNPVVPTYNYDLRTDKPPLHYYFMMLSYTLFGVNEWAARFFSVLFGALTILMTYFFTKKYLGFKTALWSCMVLLASLHVSIQFHMAVPDPYLIFFMTATLFLFFDLLNQKSMGKAYLLYVCMALGVLTKGPVAIALPGLIMLLYLIFSKQFQFKKIAQLRPLEGILIVLLLVLPWYYQVHEATNGLWTKGFFMEHNLERFSSTKENHGGMFFIAPLYTLAGLFPFAVFFIKAGKNAYRKRKNPLLLFAMIATLSISGFFAISSTQLPNYTTPTYPFFAIILGTYLSRLKQNNWKAELIAITLFAFILLPLAVAASFVDSSVPDLSAYGLAALPAIIASAFAWHYYRQKHSQKALLALAFGFFLYNLSLNNVIYSNLARSYSARNILEQVDPKESIAYYKSHQQAIPFYLQKHIPKLSDPEELKAFFRENPRGNILTHKKRIRNIPYQEYAFISFQQTDLFEGKVSILLKGKK